MSEQLHNDQFDAAYKVRMIQAYPYIAQMNADEMFYATQSEMEAAFSRLLHNRNLKRTHEMHLEDNRND